jgi:hypothetical protein
MNAPARTAGLIGLVLLVAACGGTAASSSPADGEPTAPAQSDAPAPTAEPGDEATPEPDPSAGGGGGGGGTDDVCALVTVDELEQIFGVSSVTTRVLAGPPDTCDIQNDGAPLAAFVLVTSNGAAIFSAWASDPDAVDIPGLGDRAIYSPGSLLLVVLKGDRAMSIAAFDDGRSEDERLELMKETLAIAVNRL